MTAARSRCTWKRRAAARTASGNLSAQPQVSQHDVGSHCTPLASPSGGICRCGRLLMPRVPPGCGDALQAPRALAGRASWLTHSGSQPPLLATAPPATLCSQVEATCCWPSLTRVGGGSPRAAASDRGVGLPGLWKQPAQLCPVAWCTGFRCRCLPASSPHTLSGWTKTC